MKKQVQEEKFCGKIDKIIFGIEWDGTNDMIIDGKTVMFESPGSSQGNADEYYKGKLIGFKFLQGPERKEDAKKYYGKKVGVYASFDIGYDGNGKESKKYTIYGKKKYYIKLVE